MANYTTLDFITDLTPAQMAAAGELSFSPYTSPISGVGWDAVASYQGNSTAATIPQSVFKINLLEGGTYDFSSLSRFDPGTLRVYDHSGNAIAMNIESDDGDGVTLGGALYLNDVIWKIPAPYTGTYYIVPDWSRTNLYGYHSVDVFVDLDTIVPFRGQTATGADSAENLFGGDGSDSIIALDGDDTVTGGAGDDDLNGNRGLDRVFGGAGADSVRGGQGDDAVYGGDGNDPHVNGNLGDDMALGGAGDDTVFGGQGNDTLSGEAGADLLSGDLGYDILRGGVGADRFALRAGSGFDWVADFQGTEGDRVQLLTGAAYSVRSYENQVVITLASGDELGLAGVAPDKFQTGWIIFV